MGRLLPFKTLPHQRPLRVESSYRQLREVKFRFSPESGHTQTANSRGMTGWKWLFVDWWFRIDCPGLLICTEIWAKNGICLYLKLPRLKQANSLSVLLGAVPDLVNSNMQKHGQYWMQINRYIPYRSPSSPAGAFYVRFVANIEPPWNLCKKFVSFWNHWYIRLSAVYRVRLRAPLLKQYIQLFMN